LFPYFDSSVFFLPLRIMRLTILSILISIIFGCTPKGPQTFDSPYVGKSREELIAAKGAANEVKIYDNAEVFIYKSKEEYYGKRPPIDKGGDLRKPKEIVVIEHIYYVNNNGKIYKYQVWRKRYKNK
jgi:hypothetical protein